MGTLFIDRKDIHIKLDGNTLVFYSQKGREDSYPILPLSRIIVVGNVTLDSNVIHKLASENISVVFLTGRNMRFAGMLHGSLHYNGQVRVKQYQKTLTDFPQSFSRWIVFQKIESQLDFIKELIEVRKDLKNILINTRKTLEEMLSNFEKELEISSLRGVEGGASSVYFNAFTGLFPPHLNFNKRTRRPPEDPVNAMLSLGYTLLHFEMVREIEVNGLDPTIGYYHSFEYGRESLACDFVEPFRVFIDRFVYRLFKEEIIVEKDFSKDGDKAGCYLTKEGRAKFYPLQAEYMSAIRPKLKDFIRNFIGVINDEENLIHNRS